MAMETVETTSYQIVLAQRTERTKRSTKSKGNQEKRAEKKEVEVICFAKMAMN